MRPAARGIAVAAVLGLCLAGAIAPAVSATSPSNDNFASATTAKPLPFSDATNTSSASTEFGEPTGASCGTSTGATVWYSFSSSTKRVLQASTVGSDYDTTIGVFTGASVGSLATVACDDDITAGDGTPLIQSRVTWTALANTLYYIQVGGWAGAAGNLDFDLRQVTPPGNDKIANARNISSLPASVTANTANATVDPGEFTAATGTCLDGGASVWYHYRAHRRITVRVETLGAAIDTLVAIYSGSPGNLSPVACGTYNAINDVSSYASSIAWRTTPGTDYYIQVMGNGGQSQSGIPVNFKRVRPPANNAFDHAKTISSLPYAAPFNLRNATVQPGEPIEATTCLADELYHSLWFKYTPSSNVDVTASDPSGPFQYHTIVVYTGTSVSSLTEVACTTGDSVDVHLTGGTTYYFRVDGYFGAPGMATFGLELTPP